MKIASWNIRGFNHPLKQNGAKHLIRSNQLDILAILESKCSWSKIQKFIQNKLVGWSFIDNFANANGGRIVIFWNPASVDLEEIQKHGQIVHCIVKCKVSSVTTRISFIYAANSLISRREVWQNLCDYGDQLNDPWLILGDFNNVLKPDERCNGSLVRPYETRNFEDCCSALGLLDLQSVGQLFTWSNNTVLCKLDRVMVNQAWLATGRFGVANFLPATCISDHSPALVSLLNQSPRDRPSFRFFNMWTLHSDFISIVASSWLSEIRGTAQFVLCKKLNLLKSSLKLLNKHHFSHILARVLEVNSALEAAEVGLQSDPSNLLKLAEITCLRQSAFLLSNAERSFLQQKAKCDYLIHGDKCTKFFHSIVRRNANRNFIAAVTLPDGSFTTSNDQVANAFVCHFSSLLGSRQTAAPADQNIIASGPVLVDEQAIRLTEDISEAEIWAALNNIGDNKSPGPDGFSAKFFKSAWPVVGSSVTAAIQEFFMNSILLKQINHAVIALIPKTSHAAEVGDFRPIACCNVIYKIIAKILANRIRPLLDSLVDRAQSAFIPGRHMVDNIHLMQELLRGYNRKRSSPRCTIKIDLKKAFDSISWDFMKQVLLGLNFPKQFISWVMECVSSTSYSIAINGNVHGFFKGRRGLRQGDPLSPYLFILCLEYLSRSIKLATAVPDFNFHPKCGSLRITHLAFADDLMLLSRGDSGSIGILMHCLRDFGACSGLHMNISKSNIYLAGLDRCVSDDILAVSQLSVGSMPFRYLGIPLAASSLKLLNFAPLLEAISNLLKSWEDMSLSYAGRTELIRSVLQGVQCFWLAIFPLPATVRSLICRLCRKFLWGSKLAPVAWADICLPKKEGGLGIRDLKGWNSALLAKSLWNISSMKESLWIKWIHHQYLGFSSIWNKTAHSRDSPLIKNLLDIRDRLLLHCGSVSAAVLLLQGWFGRAGSMDANPYDFFRLHKQFKPWSSLVWDPLMTPKHSFILWLGLKGRLNTKDRLNFLDISPRCVFCSNLMESARHLFFQCQFSQSVWGSIRGWLGLHRPMSSLEATAKFLKKFVKGSSWQSKTKRIAFGCTVYYIWMARNKRIFEGCSPNQEKLIYQIKTHVYRVIFGHFPHVDNWFRL